MLIFSIIPKNIYRFLKKNRLTQKEIQWQEDVKYQEKVH